MADIIRTKRHFVFVNGENYGTISNASDIIVKWKQTNARQIKTNLANE